MSIDYNRPQVPPLYANHDPYPTPPVSRREERRRDRQADRKDALEAQLQIEQMRREENRKDNENKAKLKADAKKAADRQKASDKTARTAARKIRAAAIKSAVTEHMPVIGLAVVAASMIVGWSGQAEAALHMGMGWASILVPVLTEGATLTFAAMTAHAIHTGRPHTGLMFDTWAMAFAAAGFNAAGHLLESPGMQGYYRAFAFAFASLLGVYVWYRSMKAKRAEVSGDTATRKRLHRWHPVIARRAQLLQDNTGMHPDEAWAIAWERTKGAPPGQLTIREIRSGRRSGYKRRVASAWDGRRWRDHAVDDTFDDGEDDLTGDPGSAPHDAPEGHRPPPSGAPSQVHSPGGGLYLPDGPRTFRLVPLEAFPSAPFQAAPNGTKTAGSPAPKGSPENAHQAGAQTTSKGTSKAPPSAASKDRRKATTVRIGRKGKTRRTSLTDDDLDTRARTLLEANPDLSIRNLKDSAGCSDTRAKQSLIRIGHLTGG